MNDMQKEAPLPVTADAPIGLEGAPDTGRPFVAFCAGLAAALLCAVIWSVIMVQAKVQGGFMAVGLGFVVGAAVRKLGNGNTPTFSTIGAFCTIVGCALGNFFAACGLYAAAQDRPLVLVVAQVMDDPITGLRLMQAIFNPWDLIYYAIAIFLGYRLSRRSRW